MEHEFLFDRDGIALVIRSLGAARAAGFATLVEHPKKQPKAGARET